MTVLTSPEAVDQVLRSQGTSLDGVVSLLPPHGEDDVVMFTGSFVEGFANTRSDIDITVITADPRPETPETPIDQAGFTEILRVADDREINVDYWSEEKLVDIAKALRRISPALSDPKRLRRIPVLGWHDLRILHRVRTGVALHNGPGLDRWRDELLIEILPTYLTVYYLLFHLAYLEDALAALDAAEAPETAIGMARLAAEQLVDAALAAEQETLPDAKWRFEKLTRLDEPDLTAFARDALFPSSDAGRSYVEWVAQSSRTIRDDLTARHDFARRALEHLEQGMVINTDIPS